MSRRGLTVLFVFINLTVYGFAIYSLVFKGGPGKKNVPSSQGQEVLSVSQSGERTQKVVSRLTSPLRPTRSPFQSFGYGGGGSVALATPKPLEIPAFRLRGYMADAKDASAVIEFDGGGSQTVKRNDRIGEFLVASVSREALVVENAGRKYRVTSDSVEEIK